MAGYRRQNTDGPNSEDKALDLFAEMMIEKLETISKDWKKPWFTEGSLQWPRNLSGREYNGMNALMRAPVLAA
jgi:antirestriction protein ArdC